MSIRDVLNTLVAGQPLSEDQATHFFEQLLAGNLEPAQIGAALAMIQQRGVSVDELVAGAKAMRGHVTPVPVDPAWGGVVIDTCGTGGAPKTFNVSTLAAIVAAAAGNGMVRVAKHGNKSRTGRGSAELLEAMGVNVHATPAQQSACLRDANVCFCFAIHHHPAAKFAAPVRQSLGFPTVFNLLGPLTNPAGATRQLLGVYHPVLAEKVAHALSRLGCERAMVLHSDDGLDELTITADTRVWNVEGTRVRDGRVTLHEVETMGLHRARLEELQVPDLSHAMELAYAVLRDEASPARDMVVLNAGAALWAAGVATALSTGVDKARASLARGDAWAILEKLRYTSQA